MRYLLILLCLTACITPKKVAQICAACPVRDSVITYTETVVRDSLVQLPADSSWLKLWLECDSLGRMVIVDSAASDSGRIKIQTVVQDRYIRITAKTDTAALFLRWKEQHTKQTVIREKLVQIPATLTPFQAFRLSAFWYLLLAVGIMLIFVFIKLLR